MDKNFFDACETEFYSQSPLPQAGVPVGKLFEVVKVLWRQGVNPLVILNLVQWIMSLLSQFNTLSVDELVAKVLSYLGLKGQVQA